MQTGWRVHVTAQEPKYCKRGPPNPGICLLKTCVCTLTRLNFNHLQRTLGWIPDTYRDAVSIAQF